MKLTLDVAGLAEALSLSPITVRQYASKCPQNLPPRLDMPQRKLVWAVRDVEAWIEAHRQKPPQDTPAEA